MRVRGNASSGCADRAHVWGAFYTKEELRGPRSLARAVAIGTIVLGTLVIHLIVSWWPTLEALI